MAVPVFAIEGLVANSRPALGLLAPVVFVATAEKVPEAWSRIDSLLASATQNVKKAS